MMAKKNISMSKEDRISDLPDYLIQHILSLLPSTKQAIRTGVLSKRWHKQWTAVPVLIIDSDDTNCENILKFYDCLQIQKFDLRIPRSHSHFDEMLCLATSRHVHDLAVSCFRYGDSHKVLPELFFDNVSLLKLSVRGCEFTPKGKVNWAHLKELDLCGCQLSNQAMKHILSGCPLVELFELVWNSGFDELVIRSESLKRLVVSTQRLDVLEISCPNLKELTLSYVSIKDSSLFDRVVKNVLSICSSLESLKLDNCSSSYQLAIASQSLKKLVIGDMKIVRGLQVSCAKLEKLKFFGKLEFAKSELMNLPSTVFAEMDIYESIRIIDILQQLHHVNRLKLGRLLIADLSGLQARDVFCPVLDARCLFLKYPGWDKEQLSGVACALRNLPMLETLVITEEDYKLYEWSGTRARLNNFDETNWNPICSCLASHLKTVKIIGLLRENHKVILLFIEFLLKKARALENMVIEFRHCGTKFLAKVSQKLLKMPRCSPLCIVECYELV